MDSTVRPTIVKMELSSSSAELPPSSFSSVASSGAAVQSPTPTKEPSDVTRRRSRRQGAMSTLSENIPPQATLGQFSYAPATQTTVVTTTTTTTTSFPPIVFKPPRHLTDLDPKMYPLAAFPTPPELKKICFNLGGTTTFFTEADHATEAFNDLKQQRASLNAAHGILRNVTKPEPEFDSQGFRSGRGHGSSGLCTRQVSRPGAVPKKRPASPVSISEAAELASRSGSRRKRRNISHGVPEDATGSPYRVHQTPRQQSNLAGVIPTTPNTGGSVPTHRKLPGPSSRRQGLQAQRSPSLPAATQRQSPGTSSSQTESSKTVSFLAPEHHPDAESDNAPEPAAFQVDGKPTALRSASAATATPPIVDTDLDYVGPGYSLNHIRPSPVNTVVAQDASLPSPSLSPVTAARNHGALGSFEESGHDADIESSFELPPARGDARDDVAAWTLSTSLGSQDRNDAIHRVDTAGERNPQLPSPTLMEMPNMIDAFEAMPLEMQTYMMYQFLRRCSKPTLRFVTDVVHPALKCDFLALLPLELSLSVVKHLDYKSLCRAAQVSKRWRQIINCNEGLWKEIFDRDGYTLSGGELQRAIKEGWGWQIPSGKDDYERDISSLTMLKSDSEASTVSRVGIIDRNDAGGSESCSATRSRRPKRKAAAKLSSRKRVKMESPSDEFQSFTGQMAVAEGPYAAAAAAARVVPDPCIGLPSLRCLHLYKSLYRRHHAIRNAWMREDVQPGHIAFRAHQRHVVTCLQFDSEKILTGSDDTNINVYDTQTGALRTRLVGHEGGVWALQYEGNVLVSGSTDRSVRVWNIERGICTQVFHGHTSTVRCLQILSPTEIGQTTDGKPIMMPKEPLIITGSRDSTLRVWKLPQPGDPEFFAPGPLINDADCPYFVRALAGHIHSVRAIAAHADTLVSGSYDCTVRVWKISTGETLHRLQGHTQKVYSVVLDHKRNRCISGSMDNLVKVWSLETGAVLFNLEGHTSLVGLLDLNCDRLVSAAADSTLRIWDPEFGQCRSTLSAHTGAITCFQHDGQKVVSGSDRTVKMWNAQTGEFVRDLLTDLSGVWQVKFNERRCVVAVQRNSLTYIEVIDFGCSRDAIPDDRRGRRVVVNSLGHETTDSNDSGWDDAGTPES